MRLALWRIGLVARAAAGREAARPYFDYQPFYPQSRAYTALLDPIEPGRGADAVAAAVASVGVSSSLHFQMAPDGRLTSPQAPAGAFRKPAEGPVLSRRSRSSTNAVLAENRFVLNERRDASSRCSVNVRRGPSPTGAEVTRAASATPDAGARALRSRPAEDRQRSRKHRPSDQAAPT